MTDERLDDLIHGSVDGTNTPAENEELRVCVEADPAAAARMRDIERLNDVLSRVPTLDPPEGLREDILRRIEDKRTFGARSTAERQPWRPAVVFRGRGSGDQKGVSTMTNKKWIFAAAAAVLIVAAVGYVGTRFPPGSDEGTAGTIGAVKKHSAPQISEKDVVLGTETAAAWAPHADLFADASALGSMGSTLGAMASKLEAKTGLDNKTLQGDFHGMLNMIGARTEQLGQRVSEALTLQVADYGKILQSQALDLSSDQISALKLQVGDVSKKLGSASTFSDLSALVAEVQTLGAKLNAKTLLEAKSFDALNTRLETLNANLQNAASLDSGSVGALNAEIGQLRTMLGARNDVLAAYTSLDRAALFNALDLEANTLERTKIEVASMVDKLGASTRLEARDLEGFGPQLNQIAAKLLEQKTQLEAQALQGLSSQLDLATLQAKSLSGVETRLALASKTLDARSAAFDRQAFLGMKESLGAMSEALGSQSLDTNRQIGDLVRVQTGSVDRILQARETVLGMQTLSALQGYVQTLGARSESLLGAQDLAGVSDRISRIETVLKARTAGE